MPESVPGTHSSHTDDDGCACDQCVSECERFPGWLTPSEALRLMNDGYGDQLMVDELHLFSRDSDRLDIIEVLACATVGSEGAAYPVPQVGSPDYQEWFDGTHRGQCTFLRNGNCSLHNVGKPSQCRTNYGCRRGSDHQDNYDIGVMWATPEGAAVRAQFKAVTHG